MKYVKMLGLAAVAAAALMAFVGASSASATVLCKTALGAGGTCPSGWAMKAGDELHAVLESGTSAVLTEEAPEHTVKVIVCTSSTVQGKVTEEGTSTTTAKGEITTLDFTGCTSPKLGGTACTVTTLKGGTLEAHVTGTGPNGTLTSNGAEVTTSCNSIFGTIHCIFQTANTNVGVINGSSTTGKTATFKANEALLNQVSTSVLCPEKAGWDGEYEVTTPDTLNVGVST